MFILNLTYQTVSSLLSLTIQGGGSHSINLTGCSVSGKVVLDKEGGEAPRLHLTNTPISQVEANKPAILEADDAASAITTVTAKANVEVKGGSTAISSITVPAAVSAPVAVTVTAGTVAKVEAKSKTTVSGAAGSVTAVVAEAPVIVASEAVNKVEIPATAGAGVTVAVTGTTALEVEVNSTNGAAITASGGATIDVSTTLDTPPANVTVGGTPVAHIHKWNAGVVTREPSCSQDGEKIYTCTAAGCADPAATKTEETPRLPHTVVEDPAVAATCTTPGKTAGSHCSVCSTVIVAQKDIPAKGHTEVIDPAVAATCTTPGKTEGNHKHICSSCKTEETAAHNWDEGVVTTPPTESTEGVKTYTCTACVATKTESIPVVSDSKIILTQDEYGGISVTWDAVDGITSYALDIVNDSQVDNPNHPFLSRTQPSSPNVNDLRPLLPQVAETTQGLTIIVYTCNSDYTIKDEIGRLTHVLDITVAGEAVEYAIDYNTPDTDKHKVTITKGATDYYVSNWHNKLGQKIFFGFNFIQGGGNETTEQKKLNDGDFFDLRALTSFVLENSTISATITPQSKNTYTAS